MTESAVLELADVTKAYGARTVVDGVSLVVRKGETVVILGTSGSGKSTTLKMVNRLVEPTSGNIRLFGQDAGAQDVSTLRRAIGYVIQDVGLFPHYTVRENIALVPTLLGWPRDRIRERVDTLLDTLGLTPADYAERYPADLSGGQRQRVGFARALAANPPVVLLDEPFGSLDPMLRQQLQREFLRIKERLKTTMLLVTHDIAEAITLADRICLLDRGRVQQIGTAPELIFRPENAFVEAFFDRGRLQHELMATPIALLAARTPQTPPDGTAREIEPQRSLADLLEDHSIGQDTRLSVALEGASRIVTRRALLEAYLLQRTENPA